MKKEENKRICLGESSHLDQSYAFSEMLKNINRIITPTVLLEYGLPFTADVVRRFVASDPKLRDTVAANLKKGLFTGDMLPIIRREREKMYENLMLGFDDMKAKVYSAVGQFRRFEKMFLVSEDGKIEVMQECLDIIEDEKNIYIDQSEQIEAYEAACKVLEDIEKLDEIARKYFMRAFGGQNSILCNTFGKITINVGAITACYPQSSHCRMSRGEY